jgi:hypothetical protein
MKKLQVETMEFLISLPICAFPNTKPKAHYKHLNCAQVSLTSAKGFDGEVKE